MASSSPRGENKYFYTSVQTYQRHEKIDEENETRTELYEERSKAKDRKKKAVIESLLVSYCCQDCLTFSFRAHSENTQVDGFSYSPNQSSWQGIGIVLRNKILVTLGSSSSSPRSCRVTLVTMG